MYSGDAVFHTRLFLFQIAVIVAVSRLVAWLFSRIGQPRVVGEMAAGIALGPTLLGYFAPHLSAALFPAASLGYLNALSQAGLVVFVFLIGVRVDFAEMRAVSRVTLTGGSGAILVPLATGLAISPWLFARYGHGNGGVFALFVGTAMSVTAFPVLARILMERGMMESRLGTVALACAAVSDLLAWVLLAIAVSLTHQGGGGRPLWEIFAFLLLFVVVLTLAGWLLQLWPSVPQEEEMGSEVLVAFIVLALLAGAAGEWIGIHAIVGAFGAGMVTPRRFRAPLIDKLETVTLVLLMPLFFALTGIRTNLVFNSTAGYGDLALILTAATASKWVGSLLGARAGGMAWRDAARLGVLMNARGLVELIVLNAGLEAGILPPAVFSMMVCMALFTTFVTSPLLNWLDRK